MRIVPRRTSTPLPRQPEHTFEPAAGLRVIRHNLQTVAFKVELAVSLLQSDMDEILLSHSQLGLDADLVPPPRDYCTYGLE